MAFRVQTSSGQVIAVEGNIATIGSDPACAISIPNDEHVMAQHAVIKKVAGRWMIESRGEHLLSVRDSQPGRIHWIHPGDTIRLSEAGPDVIFEPSSSSVPPIGSPSPAPAAPPPIVPPPVVPPPVVPPPVVPPPVVPPPVVPPPVAVDPTPSSAQPPSSSVENLVVQRQPSNNVVAWAVGGGVAVIGIALLSAGLLWATGAFRGDTVTGDTVTGDTVTGDTVTGNTITTETGIDSPPPPPGVTIPTTTPPGTTQTPPGTPRGPTQQTDSGNAASRPSPETKPHIKDALYSIRLEMPKGLTFHLGTAFAISKRRLVTTAGVIDLLEEYRLAPSDENKRPKMAATAFSSTANRGFSIDEAELTVHAEYPKAIAKLRMVEKELQSLKEQLDQAADKAAAEPIDQKITQQEYKRYQALKQLSLFDLGVIEVKNDLTYFLEAADTKNSPRAGAKILLAGIPIKHDEVTIDFDTPPMPAESGGRVLVLKTFPGNPTVRRLIVTCQRDISGQHWRGSPVLNSSGKVIGVYSQPTPPLFGKQAKGPTLFTHDIISINQLIDVVSKHSAGS